MIKHDAGTFLFLAARDSFFPLFSLQPFSLVCSTLRLWTLQTLMKSAGILCTTELAALTRSYRILKKERHPFSCPFPVSFLSQCPARLLEKGLCLLAGFFVLFYFPLSYRQELRRQELRELRQSPLP